MQRNNCRRHPDTNCTCSSPCEHTTVYEGHHFGFRWDTTFFCLFIYLFIYITNIGSLFTPLQSSSLNPPSPSPLRGYVPLSLDPGASSLCGIRHICSHWGRQGNPVGEQIPQSGYSFGNSPCFSCWGTHMETELYICYICAGRLGPPCHKDTCFTIFRAALFVSARNWK